MAVSEQIIIKAELQWPEVSMNDLMHKFPRMINMTKTVLKNLFYAVYMPSVVWLIAYHV